MSNRKSKDGWDLTTRLLILIQTLYYELISLVGLTDWTNYGSDRGARTPDNSITQTLLFIVGVDYIITHKGVPGAIGDYRCGSSPLVSAPSRLH